MKRLKEEAKSFGFAFRGAKLSLQERHVRVHLGAGVMVLIANALLQVSAIEWAITVACACFVIVTEVINTVFEETMDFVHPEHHDRVGRVKDLAAGAVFFAAGGAVIVAGIIYLPKVYELLVSNI